MGMHLSVKVFRQNEHVIARELKRANGVVGRLEQVHADRRQAFERADHVGDFDAADDVEIGRLCTDSSCGGNALRRERRRASSPRGQAIGDDGVVVAHLLALDFGEGFLWVERMHYARKRHERVGRGG